MTAELSNVLATDLAEAIAQWPDPPSAVQVTRLARHIARGGDESGRLRLRLGIASSFTFDFMVNPLLVRSYCEGFQLSAYVSPFGQYAQDLIDPQSALHRHAPDALLVAIRWQDALPALSERFNSLTSAEIDGAVTEWKRHFSSMLSAFRDRSSALILCTNYEQPAYLNLGLADRSAAKSQRRIIEELNDWLYQVATELGRMSIVDVDAAAARCGRENWIDPKLELLARSPVAAAHHWNYAGEFLRVLRAMTGKVRKVLALDCDNTLWGGVLGDVGRDGVALGHDYPGSAYRALQLRALELQQRGVVLVVASKNDRAAVQDVFENHREMILRPEHISYFAVDWNPKPQNLKQAAAVLNLGLDSFVFLDDHPVECDMMRQMLPDVVTVQLPKDPALFERTLSRLNCFDQLVVSAEDRSRASMYRQEAQRAELKEQAPDLESFYHSLRMIMSIGIDDTSQVARAAQLTQRTNQFNMTTIRRSEVEIRDLMTSPTFHVYSLSLEDRFGDNGIVGLAIVETAVEEWMIETFLMSCRVLGRTVEHAFLQWIAEQARASGAPRLGAKYSRSKKNASFAGFYESCGMTKAVESAAEGEVWYFDLSLAATNRAIPDWIQLKVEKESTVGQ